MKYSWSKNQFSLRTSLIVPLVVQVIITVSLVGYLAFTNGREAINDIVQQLRSEIAERVTTKLQEFTHAPFLLNQMNMYLLDGAKFPLNQSDGKLLSRKLWLHLPSFPTVAYSYFAESSSGHFYGASRIHDVQLATIISNYNKNQEYIIYRTQPNGQLDAPLRTVSNYEPRERHWYKTALERKTVAWSQVYVGFSTRSLMLTAVQPLFNASGQLLGVFGVDVTLNQISQFLSSLKIGKHGQSFIIDREGLLIASSSELPSFNAQNQRIAAVDFAEPTIHATANFLTQQFDLKKLDHQFYLNFQLNYETQFVQIMPFKDTHGLDWLFVTTVPENDFIQQIRNNTRFTILLCIIAVMISAGMGLLTTHFINTPIRKLGDAARAIAEGNMEQRLITSRIVELELLINYFNEMAKQLKISFCILEARNTELQSARDDLAMTFSQLEAVLNAMPGAIFWVDVTGHYMGVNQFFASLCKLSPDEFIGRPLDFVHQNPIFVEFVYQFLAREPETIVGELPIHLINRREHYCLIVAQKYQSSQMAVFISLDISNRKRAEEERQHFVEKLANLNRAYERFVPREFLRCLNKQSVEEIELGDQIERKMTILFADIRNFTTISEQLSPQENFDFLNAYLREISPVIREHHGFIDKYIGDAIVALFPNQADDAVLAALGMLQRLNEFNQQQQGAKWAPVRIGIGINTGMLMLGTIGEENRMDSTVISDAVNLASRLENLTKQYGVELLISEYTYQQLQNRHAYLIQLLDSEVKIKGRNELLAIYEVIGKATG